MTDQAVEPGQPARLTGHDLTRIVWRGLAAGLIGWAVLRAAGFVAPVYGVLPVGVAAFAVARVVRATHAPEEEPLPRASASDPPPDRPFAAVTRLEDRLAWAQQDRARFDSVIRPQLASLVDERLRQHHGVQRGSNPQRARSIVGDELWQLMHAQEGDAAGRGSGPGPTEIARLVQLIEAI